MQIKKWLKKAENKHSAGDHTTAKVLYKKILKLNPDHVDANYLLGALLAEKGETRKALHYTLKAESVTTRSPYIKNNLGNLYRMSGDDTQAEKYFNDALAIDPGMPEALNNLGILYRRLNCNEQAIQYYLGAINADPTFVAAYYNLGKTYKDEQNTQHAIDCFTQALKLHPHHILSHNELGDCYMSLQQKDLALYHFKEYLHLCKQDDCGVALKMARLSEGELPDRHPTELVRQSYALKARDWDQNVSRPNMEFLGPQLIQAMLKDLSLRPMENTVLDLGCGTGLCGPALKPFSQQLDGVDLSKQMLQIAASKSLYDHLTEGDAEWFLRQNPGRYQLVCASGVLIFFGDLSAMMQAAAQAISPNGVFLFTTYKSQGDAVQIRNNLHFAHSADHIRKTAGAAGLRVARLDEVIHEYDFGEPQRGYAVCLVK